MYTFSINLPGCKSSIEQIDYFCDHCLKLLHLSKHRKILFAIHEAVINAVAVHEENFSGTENNLIKVNIEAKQGDLTVKVIDSGQGFNHDQLKGYTEQALSNMFSDRGRGLMFIEKFTDKWQFEHLPDGTFCVTLYFLNE